MSARALAARAYWGAGGPALRGLPGALGRWVPAAVSRAARPSRSVRAAMAAALPAAAAGDLDLWAREEARLRLHTRLERLRYPAWTDAEARARVTVIGAEALDTALARGRGVVLVAAHFGLHALPPLALSLLGWPVAAVRVMRPDAELGSARGWSQAQRRAMEDALPAGYIDAGDDAPLRAALGRGEVLVMGGDGDGVGALTGHPDHTAPLLGRPTAWPTAPYAVARDAGAAPLGLWPDSGEAGHQLLIRPLDADDPQRDFIEQYERWLRARPGQWQFWRR